MILAGVFDAEQEALVLDSLADDRGLLEFVAVAEEYLIAGVEAKDGVEVATADEDNVLGYVVVAEEYLTAGIEPEDGVEVATVDEYVAFEVEALFVREAERHNEFGEVG